MSRTTLSERCLVLAPGGRDAALAGAMLGDAGIEPHVCASLTALVDELDCGAGAVVVTEEALEATDLHRLSDWIDKQDEWSDLPFVLLTFRGGGLERNPAARRYLKVLGNVTFVERPFHPTTLISLVEAALRGRRRQYEARSRLEALRDGELRYRTLFNSMDEGFCIIEFVDGSEGPLTDYVHVEANAAYERHAGIANVVGQHVRAMVPGEAQGWIDLYGKVLRTGVPIRFERELVATGRHLELAAFRIEPATRLQVAVLFQDITARRRAETALRELNDTLERRVADALAEQKLLADIVEGTDAFVQVADTDFRWLAINKAAADEFERIFGVRPKVGDRMLDLLEDRPEHREAVKAVWQRALDGEAFVEIGEFGDPGRDRRYYEMKFNVLRAPDGTAIGAYQFVYDVTQRLRDQARLTEATAQVHEMAKLETLGQLTGGVAHDFNNLLTPITGALDMLSRGEAAKEPRAARLIDGALQSAERAKTLVQRLLGFARRQALQSRPVDVPALLEGMHDLIASSVGAGIEVVITADDDLPAAKADPNQLELAILNLCVNARDAMTNGGRLSITTRREIVSPSANPRLSPGAYVCISVADTGVGMDETTLARAVEPFFSTKETGRGTGLGLSMVHGLAGQLGGAFLLASKLGEGSRAELYLPVAEAAAVGSAGVGGVHRQQPADVYRILLVDDEDLVRAGTAEMLRDLGHSVVEASGGAEALAKFHDGGGIDLVVTDFTMPRMDGAELVTRLRQRNPQLPALVVTGYAGADLNLGLPQLAKPFRQADLGKLIQDLMDPPTNVVAFQSGKGGR